jgi:hypothetical protein
MKRILLATALAAAAAISTAPAHAASIGVSIGFAAPGAYGRVDIGHGGAVGVSFGAPVIVGAPVPAAAPVYLWVPPAHRAHWAAYCASYGACGVPVYFVDDGWYHAHVYAGPVHPWPVGYGYGYGYGYRPVPAPRPDYHDGHPYRPYYPNGANGAPGSHGYHGDNGHDHDGDHDGDHDRGDRSGPSDDRGGQPVPFDGHRDFGGGQQTWARAN